MNGMREWTVQCPYCSEENELLIDPSIQDQDYVEDCQVCCQPMRVRAIITDGEVVMVDVTRENE